MRSGLRDDFRSGLRGGLQSGLVQCGVAALLLAVASAIVAPAAIAQTQEERIVEARAFLDVYQSNLKARAIPSALAHWKAATTGKKEDFDAAAAASLAVRRYHSDAELYQQCKQYWDEVGDQLPPVDRRELELALKAFRANQLPPDLLKEMVELATEIEKTFNTYRAELDGKRYSNNELLEMLRTEDDSDRREAIWSALKQVGAAVAPRLVELAKVRNRAARKLGYQDYWHMKIDLQEHDPKHLTELFDELDHLTRASFAEAKGAIDAELARRFGVDAEALMPWHYDNPFFQAVPPSEKIDLDTFYDGMTKEDIADISRRYFGDVRLPVGEVLARSDLYEREGKDQHAFCTHIDHSDDVRILCNLKPTATWMETQLHELGHAVYDLYFDRDLPYSLRSPAHTLATEAVAMYFGALPKNPDWLVRYVGASREDVEQVAETIAEQRRREQLVFARWTLVMFHVEKAFYADPDRDISELWWQSVERYQLLRRPAARHAPDWAAKPHFTIAPVYYHNYMLGELLAAQLRHVLREKFGDGVARSGMPSEDRRDAFADYFANEVFSPGARWPWPEFVERATGQPLSPKFFADEVAPRP